MHYGIDWFPDEDILGYIVLQESKPFIAHQVRDVVDSPCEQIVQANDFVPAAEQAIAEVTSQKTGSTGDNYSHNPPVRSRPPKSNV